MSYRGNGGRIGTLNLPSVSSSSGIFTLSEQQQLQGASMWPGTAQSPQQLANAGVTTDGFYSYKTGSMAQAVSLYTRFNMADSRPWVRVFSSPFASTATVNEVNKNIPWKGFLIQRDVNDYRNYSYFSTNQLFNTRQDNSTASGGNKGGFRIFIGYAGGHGFYNTGQAPCNWNEGTGAVGAGYDGSCGTFPNAMRWGLGQAGTPNYTMVSGTWETWIWWE